jgi:hypothetical protein
VACQVAMSYPCFLRGMALPPGIVRRSFEAEYSLGGQIEAYSSSRQVQIWLWSELHQNLNFGGAFSDILSSFFGFGSRSTGEWWEYWWCSGELERSMQVGKMMQVGR